MANAFELEGDGNALARVAAALVSKDLKVAGVVNRDYSAEFAAGRGATVYVRIPGSLAANTRAVGTTGNYSQSDVTESTQAVALTADLYSSVTLTDDDVSLNLEDFSKQVLRPQTLAIAEAAEALVIAKLQSVTEDAAMDTAIDFVSAPLKGLVAMRKALRAIDAPESGLFVAVGLDIYEALLNAAMDAGNNVDADPASGKFLRLGGFEIIESNRLAAKEIIGFHRDAITLAMRPPAPPQGAAYKAQVAAEQGVPIRHVMGFNLANGTHVSLLNCLAGTALMNTKRTATGATVNHVIRVVEGP